MGQHKVISWFFYVLESIFIGTCHTLCQCDFTPTTTMLLLKVCFGSRKNYSCHVEKCLVTSLSLTLPCWSITFRLLYSFFTSFFVGIVVDGSQALHNIFFSPYLVLLPWGRKCLSLKGGYEDMIAMTWPRNSTTSLIVEE